MKRTATTLALLAGFGGGCASPGGEAPAPTAGGMPMATQPARFGTASKGRQLPQYQGPNGEPVMARAAAPGGVVQAGGMVGGGGVQQAGFRKGGADCDTCAHVPGSHAWGSKFGGHGGGHGAGGGYGPSAGGQHNFPGILPVPGMGPPGAVAAYGAIVPGMGGPGMGGPGGATGALPNGRASVKFTGPAGMKVTWQLPDGNFGDEATGLTAPKEYNFLQGQVYRLRLTQILPDHPGRAFYPTLEVSSGNPKTLTFLAHSCVPITFTRDDFDHAVAGNLVVKVVYLPDRENQDFLTVVGAEEVNSTRLEPGVDPVAEAQRRGTVLAIIRLGNIDLENRISPAMGAPPPGAMMPPGGVMMPPGGPIPGGPIPGGPLMPPPGGMGGLPPGTSRVGSDAPLPLAPGAGPVAPVRPGTAVVPPAAPAAPLNSGPLPPAGNGKDARPLALPPVK